MEIKKLKKLVKSLRALGLTYYKDAEVELELGKQPEPRQRLKHAEPKPSAEIKHKVEDLTSIMALDDNSLVDRLFPESTIQDDAGEDA